MFTTEVIQQLGYYVYSLTDPRDGNVFYIGKGKGNRVFAHVNDALKGYDGERFLDDEEDEISAKIQQIRDIRNAGLEVIHKIQRYGLTEKEAFEVEAALIDFCPHLTNIQSGHASDRGANSAADIQKNLSAEEFLDIPGLKYCIIKITEASINENGSVYEATRKYWKINLDRMSKVHYVLASHNSVIEEVYEVGKWFKSDKVPGRCMFEGKQAPDDIRNHFINKRLPKRYIQQGMASPILYHDD